MKVLHVLESSVPDLAGYTIRSRFIVNSQRQLGLDPVVVTSPFFRGSSTQTIDTIDGTKYYRSNHIARPEKAKGRLRSYITRATMVRRYRQFVADIARRERPDVIHAHSSYMNGLAARYAADRLGLPLVYELRGLWGDTAVVEDGLAQTSWRYRLIWRMEMGVVQRANMVVAISNGIRDVLLERGVDAGKIAIVPNGVDTTVFQPCPRDRELAGQLGLTDCFVVGFIGSILRLEGISLLLDAFKDIARREPRARLLVVGDGPDRARLTALAAEGGLGDIVRFTGQVPHDQIFRYYSLMDILAYPRIDVRINQTVTPLKPLEAMALGKTCLASDVGGMRELIADDVTGVLFPAGNVAALTEKVLLLARDAELRQRLSETAQAMVAKDREWTAIVAKYPDVYRRAGAVTVNA
jgi:glycogen synthase